MDVIRIKLNKITDEQIDLIVDYLKQGKVMAYPTDTIYGLGCDCRNVEAINRIHKIKSEKNNKASLVLISDFKMLKKYCFTNLQQMDYLKKIWSTSAARPVTVILKRRPILPEELTGGLNSLAVRLPKNGFLIKIIEQAGFPLVSTSLNKKGEKALEQVDKLDCYFKYLPDLVIDAGPARRTKPSKLVDIRDIKNIKILRK